MQLKIFCYIQCVLLFLFVSIPTVLQIPNNAVLQGQSCYKELIFFPQKWTLTCKNFYCPSFCKVGMDTQLFIDEPLQNQWMLLRLVSSHRSLTISINNPYFTYLSTRNVAAWKKKKKKEREAWTWSSIFVCLYCIVFRKVKTCISINCSQRMFLNKC